MRAALAYLYVWACLLKSGGECDFANMSGAPPLFGGFACILIKGCGGLLRANWFGRSLMLRAGWLRWRGARDALE